MAGKDFQYQRHLKMWEEQNKLIKRTTLLAVVFGIFIVFKILIPSAKITQVKVADSSTIDSLRQKKIELMEVNDQLNKINITFGKVQETLTRAPWIEEKDKLIAKFSKMRNERGYVSPEEVQDTANVTIHNIANQFRQSVIAPLESQLAETNAKSAELLRLKEKVKNIRRSVDHWERANSDKIWYSTIESKAMMTRNFSEEFSTEVDSSMSEFKTIKADINAKQEELETSLNELKTDLSAIELQIEQQQAALLININEALHQILPSWLNFLFEVKKVIHVFPVILAILLAMEIYIIYLGVNLSRHYRFVAQQVNFTTDERRDLSVSSAWTMTDRGRFGNIVTWLAYIGLTIFLWLLFEWTAFLFRKLQISIQSLAFDQQFLSGSDLLWIGRVIFLSIVFVLALKSAFFKNVVKQKKKN